MAKGKKAERSSLKHPRRNPPVVVGQQSLLFSRKWPVVTPEMLSATLNVIWEFACPRMLKKHRAAFYISV